MTISFLEDAAGCPHYAKPESTLVTLFAPSQHGYSLADDLDGKTVTDLPGSVCPAGGLVKHVMLKQQLGKNDCTNGLTFGYRNEIMWIQGGCSGRFLVQIESKYVYTHLTHCFRSLKCKIL